MAETQRSELPNASEVVREFIQFVMGHAENVLFLLGKIRTPDGATMPPNLQAAKMLIDQLEMIKIKTKGNLNQQEIGVLENALTTLKMAFVEVSGGTPPSMMATSGGSSFDAAEMDELETPAPAPQPERPAQQTAEPSASPSKKDDDEDKRKFFKAYG
ncbi:MAG: DUF1844 domain-containing protein [bacterium]